MTSHRLLQIMICLLCFFPSQPDVIAAPQNNAIDSKVNSGGANSGEANSGTPNVLFISVDDMNDWLSCLGSDRVQTPNIDALAARGLLFTNAHAPAPKCGPSRSTILLGKRAPSTGIYSNSQWWRPAYPTAVTLPRYFKNNGYYVAGAGKVHHHTDGFNPPDQWHEYSPLLDDKNLVQDLLKKQGRDFLTTMPRHPADSLDWGPVPLADMQMGDGRSIRFATEFLNRAHTKPFFLAVGLFQPHLPFYAPQPHFDAVTKTNARLPLNLPNDLSDTPKGARDLAEYRRNDLRMIEEHDSLENCIHSYIASIRHADALIGRLMQAFDDSAYAKNTIVILWSDHGYHFGEKDHYAKNTLWERSTHIPLIIAAPGVTKPNTRTTRPVDLTALYPTLIDLCSLPARTDLDGHNITPLLRNPNLNWPHPAIIDYLKGNRAIRTERYRYIRYNAGGEELYDHQTDPDEHHNLAADPAYAKIKAGLAQHYTADWLPTIPGKNAYDFDAKAYTWRSKETGVVTKGR